MFFFPDVAAVVEHTEAKDHDCSYQDSHNQLMVKKGGYAPAATEKTGNDQKQVTGKSNEPEEQCEICKYMSHILLFKGYSTQTNIDI